MTKVWTILSVLLCTFCFGTLRATETLETAPVSQTYSRFRVDAGFGASLLGPIMKFEAGGGLTTSVAYQLQKDEPYYFGLELSSQVVTNAGSLAAFWVLFPPSMFMDSELESMSLLSILPTFAIRQLTGAVKPFASLSVGPTIAKAEIYSRANGSRNEDKVHFTGLLSVGLDIALVEPIALGLEPVRLGIIGNEMLYSPRFTLAANW